ncbi:EAL and HDOD domain-containing protein [Vibrio porteresiae]|uniref:EAL domain-containing protein n=1 Tax=Vibrio porteresiae DSM 19223 TaxID=1123496 RepID=A0ABZ0Q9P4_9VIBR|nr:EAL domain-containing protein [Vibrio porteresiae]WPC73124.1 EAL domain-containing protein [Vibrio porteresiae DSM 19223]
MTRTRVMASTKATPKFSYIARQPILNSDRVTIGYELLFRDGPNNSFPEIDPEKATSQLLSDHFLSTHYHTLGGKLGFVNFPYHSLVNMIPTVFPTNSLVIEVLETCPPSVELLTSIRHMHKQGYKIALDDFIPSKEWNAFLPYVSVIKFDLRQTSVDIAKQFMARTKQFNIEFLAEKIETYDEFQKAKAAGFTLFQGYFFARPEILQHQSLDPSFLTLIQLCKEVAKDQLDYPALEAIISRDLSMSYKLLSFVNASASVSSKIQNFKQAIVYLGEQRLRRFISIVAIASAQKSKPHALYTLSIQRARFCELLWQRAKKRDNSIEQGAAFLTGMFSLLDSLLDQPLENILQQMPIDSAIKLALLQHKGTLGEILDLAIGYETADWAHVSHLADKLAITHADVISSYDDAIEWADVLMDMNL